MTGEERVVEHAKRAADALINLQNKNGSIPTVINKFGGAQDIVHVFDLGIIARGLLDVFNRTHEAKYFKAANEAIEFLQKYFLQDLKLIHSH